ncbi:collagen-like protein [Bifidobacterium samirii]|uniref:Tail type measure protein n=1 Tax=Bifidobacterium samirii TaxID=2306974 RepID=A0A430FUF3_9BIFI|nr:collagen-like protein [Bifidobacterium samirii]RSX56783.1 tail type measure protein [Bifidobacterium samirii]
MTLVHFNLTDPQGVPLSGAVACVPTRRVTVGSAVRLPIPVTIQLTDGEATVDLLPSDTQWVWRVSELVSKGMVRYVALPDETMVEYASLEDIDPATLDVDSATLAAWEQTTRQAQAALDGIRGVGESVERAESAASGAEQALETAKSFDLTVGTVRVTDSVDEAGASLHGDWPAKTLDMVIPRGPKGEQGESGERGVEGPQGPRGEAGAPFGIAKVYGSMDAMKADHDNPDIPLGSFVCITTDSIEDTENATLWVKSSTEWTFITDMSGATGLQGPQGPQGIQGPDGDKGDPGRQGDQGDPGLAATIHVGTVTTLAPGESATVTNSGNASDAVLNFAIPKGEKGDQGDPGQNGKDGIQLHYSDTLEEGIAWSKEHPDDFVAVLEEVSTS